MDNELTRFYINFFWPDGRVTWADVRISKGRYEPGAKRAALDAYLDKSGISDRYTGCTVTVQGTDYAGRPAGTAAMFTLHRPSVPQYEIIEVANNTA